MYLVLILGCRDAEATYIICHQECIRKYWAPELGTEWVATMPGSVTKSGVAYRWLIPMELETELKLRAALHKRWPRAQHRLPCWKRLATGLPSFFDEHVLKAAFTAGLLGSEYDRTG